MRGLLLLALGLGLTWLPAGWVAGEESTDVERLLTDLLALPAPSPPWEPISKATQRPVPSADEEALKEFEAFPMGLPAFVGRLPPTPEVVARVQRLYETRPPDWDAKAVERVHGWLMCHSASYRGDLVAAAEKGLRPAVFGVEGTDELEVLEDLDGAVARRLLLARQEDPHPAVRSYVLTRLFRTASAEEAPRLREQLMASAADATADAYVRVESFRALLAQRWEGDTDWWLARFGDATVRRIEHDDTGWTPLEWLVHEAPEEWIPRIVPFLGGRDRASHENAVACLVQFNGEETREDALRPLLPWLRDPQWSIARDRPHLVRSLKRFARREDLPSVMAVLETGGDWELEAASELLGSWEASAAAPALRAALQRRLAVHADGSGELPEHGPERNLLFAAIRCERMNPAEVAARLEDHLTFEERTGGKPTVEVLLGRLLVRLFGPWDVPAILGRAAELEALKPTVAAALRGLVAARLAPPKHVTVLGHLRDGTIDVAGVQELLESRDELLEDRRGALTEIQGLAGLPGGIAAALLAVERRTDAILRGEDTHAQRALLACARLLRLALPEALVIRLLDAKDARVVEAADRYLESDDRSAARKTLWARATGKARILGPRPDWDAGHFSFAHLDELEARFREEVIADGGPDEVLALLSAGYWGSPGQWILRRRGSAWTLAFERRDEETRTWDVLKPAIDELLDFVAREGIADLPAYDPAIHDGVQYELLRLTRAAGRRVFMNNPGVPLDRSSMSEDVYARILRAFRDLRRAVLSSASPDVR